MDQKKQNPALTCILKEQIISSQTPQKREEATRTCKDAKLPEKYKTIAELFNQMVSSLRLLGIRQRPPIFQTVSFQVEVLSKRKFLYKHLAQMKYLLPEALKIDKVLVHDKKTLCMRPDLKVTLLFNDVELSPQKSGFLLLRELFTSRLEDFVHEHPETYDVPEAILPAPFNQTGNIHEDVPGGCVKHTPEAFVGTANVVDTTGEDLSDEVILPVLGNANNPTALTHCSSSLNYQVTQNKPQKEIDCPSSKEVEEEDIKNRMQEDGSIGAGQSKQLMNAKSSLCSVACESPAVKASSSTESVLIETPAQLTPKISIDKTDSNQKPVTSQKCTSDHKPAKRSLDFFSLETDINGSSSILSDFESSKQVLFTRPCSTEDVAVAARFDSRPEGEEGKCILDKKQADQTSLCICQQMLSCLHGTVAVIDDVFRAVGRPSITKEELVHKIIMNNFDIVERREVEEQVELLEKLVPDWICRRLSPSGDVMYSIKRNSVLSTESVLSKLVSTS